MRRRPPRRAAARGAGRGCGGGERRGPIWRWRGSTRRGSPRPTSIKRVACACLQSYLRILYGSKRRCRRCVAAAARSSRRRSAPRRRGRRSICALRYEAMNSYSLSDSFSESTVGCLPRARATWKCAVMNASSLPSSTLVGITPLASRKVVKKAAYAWATPSTRGASCVWVFLARRSSLGSLLMIIALSSTISEAIVPRSKRASAEEAVREAIILEGGGRGLLA